MQNVLIIKNRLEIFVLSFPCYEMSSFMACRSLVSSKNSSCCLLLKTLLAVTHPYGLRGMAKRHKRQLAFLSIRSAPVISNSSGFSPAKCFLLWLIKTKKKMMVTIIFNHFLFFSLSLITGDDPNEWWTSLGAPFHGKSRNPQFLLIVGSHQYLSSNQSCVCVRVMTSFGDEERCPVTFIRPSPHPSVLFLFSGWDLERTHRYARMECTLSTYLPKFSSSLSLSAFIKKMRNRGGSPFSQRDKNECGKCGGERESPADIGSSCSNFNDEPLSPTSFICDVLLGELQQQQPTRRFSLSLLSSSQFSAVIKQRSDFTLWFLPAGGGTFYRIQFRVACGRWTLQSIFILRFVSRNFEWRCWWEGSRFSWCN